MPAWSENEWTRFYQSLNSLKHNNEALSSYLPWSKAKVIDCENSNVFAFERKSDNGNSVVTIVNLANEPTTINLNGVDLSGYKNYFESALDTLPEWGFAVLVK